MAIGVFIVVMLFGISTAKLQWKDCGSKGGAVNDVSVVGCEQASYACELHKNKNASFSIDFNCKEDANKLTAVVHGIIANVPVPFPLDNPDACKDSNIACPVKNGEHYLYKSTIFVKETYPKLSLAVRWELQDENGVDVVCILIPAKIVD